MISSRFLPVICALVALTLVPTFIHSYSDTTVHDGLATEKIPTSLAGCTGVRSDRNKTWGKRRFDSDDWTERKYGCGGDDVKLTVVRSYDAKSLYHHPELAVSYGPSYVTSNVRRLAERPDVPVHVLHADDGTLAMYVLHYDGRFVEDPIWFQLRTAGELLFSGRKAMTLLFVTDQGVSSTAKIETLPATHLLLAAVDGFLATGTAAR